MALSRGARGLVACGLLAAAAAAVSGVDYSMPFIANATLPYAHVSTWALLPSGRIVLAFQSSPDKEGSLGQRVYVTSTTDRATWAPMAAVAGNGSADVWNPVLAYDAAAGVLRLWYAQAPLAQPTSLGGDLLMVSSADEGATWGPPQMVLPTAAWGGIAKCTITRPSHITGPRGDMWALPFMTYKAFAGENGLVGGGLVASPAGNGGGGPWALLPGNATLGNRTQFHEPAVAQCASGEVLMLLRSCVGTIFASRSTDYAASFSPPVSTGWANPNSKVDLVRWDAAPEEARRGASGGPGPQAGDLVMAWNPNNTTNCNNTYCQRTPLAVSVSPDCGRSFGAPLLVEPVNGSLAFGYPTLGRCGTDPATGEPLLCVSYTYDGGQPHGIRFAWFPASLLDRGA